MLSRLFQRRLIFVTGKGGVGKSSVTAAMGLLASQQGRRVLVCEMDVFSAMDPLLGGGGRVGHEPLEVSPGLSVCNIDRSQALVTLVSRFVPSRRISRTLVTNKVTRLFFETAPGVGVLSLLHQVRRLMHEPEHELILVDLPSTGHAITFLRVPEVLHKMLRKGGVAEMAGRLAQDLRDPEVTALVVVSLPEEMPVNETIELHQVAREKLGMSTELVIVNMVRPSPVSAQQREALEFLAERVERGGVQPPGGVARLVEGGEIGLGWNKQDRRYVERLHSALQEHGVHFVEVPYVYETDREQGLVQRIAQLLQQPVAS